MAQGLQRARPIPLGLIVFLGSLATFVGGMAPGLYLRDSGELTTAVFSLGVAHETGFALYCLLGKAIALVPLGEVATRVNFASALAAAAATWLVYRLVLTLTAPTPSEQAPEDAATQDQAAPGSAVAVEGTRIVGALLAAALFAGGYTVWKQATVAEVYTPTAAAMALALLLCARLDGTHADLPAAGEPGAGLTLWLLLGFGLGLHASLRLLVVPLAALLTAWRLRRGQRWPLLAPLAFAVGAAIVFYLPVAASRAPIANWGDARTLGGLVDHLLAVRIRRAFSDQILTRDPALVARHLALFVGQVEAQLGLPALLLGVTGLAFLLRRRRAIGLLVGALIGGDVLYAAWINPMGIEDLQCGVPTALGIAVCAGIGLTAAARLVRASERRATVAGSGGGNEGKEAAHGRLANLGAAAFATGLAGIAIVPPLFVESRARFGVGQEAPAWTAAALREAPSRALMLTRSDDLSAGLMYAQAAWGARPDVTVLVRQHLFDARYVARMIARGGSAVLPGAELEAWRARPEPARIRDERHLLATLVAGNLAGRAILWEPGEDAPPSGNLEPAVPLFRLLTAPVAAPPAHPLVAQISALLGEPGDPLARGLEAGALTSLGASYFALGDDLRAASLFDTALKLRSDDAAAATNLAIVHARHGDLAGALRLVDRVLEREPDRLVARQTAGRLRLETGDLDGAEADFARAQRLAPGTARPFVGLARVAHARGHDAEARRLVDEALALTPRDPEALALSRMLPR